MLTHHRRIRGDLQPIVQTEAQLLFVFKMLAPFIHRLSLEGPQVIAEVGEGCCHGCHTFVRMFVKVRASHIQPCGEVLPKVSCPVPCPLTPLIAC